jgi:hypothetical protein
MQQITGKQFEVGTAPEDVRCFWLLSAYLHQQHLKATGETVLLQRLARILSFQAIQDKCTFAINKSSGRDRRSKITWSQAE